MNRRKRMFVLAIVVPLAGLIWFLLPERPDPQLIKVQQMQEKLFDRTAKMEPGKRREAFGQLRQEFEKLTPEQRDQLMRENPPPPMRQMQENIVAFFQLPEEERTAALDKQIDEFEKMRKQFERNRGDGPPGPFRNMSEAQRNEFRRKMLDNSTAQQRGMFGEYFQALEARRRQRGLPAMPFPGG